jgi:hypothetical protein
VGSSGKHDGQKNFRAVSWQIRGLSLERRKMKTAKPYLTFLAALVLGAVLVHPHTAKAQATHTIKVVPTNGSTITVSGDIIGFSCVTLPSGQVGCYLATQ